MKVLKGPFWQIYVVCQGQCHYPPPARRLPRKAAQCQLSQLVSTRIKLDVSSKCQKVAFSSDSTRKMALWLSLAQI